MKKGLKIIGIMLATVLLAGCYKINTNMSINSDKSMDFEMIYAMDNDMMKSLEDSFDEDEQENLEDDEEINTNDEEEEEPEDDDFESLRKSAKEKGFDVEEYNKKENDHNWVGIKITKKYKNIDDVSKDKEVIVNFISNSDDNVMFDDSQYFMKKNNTYKANFVFDFGSSAEGVENMSSSFDLKFVLNLPSKSISNNASKTENDGKTLIWNLDLSKKNEVKFEFKLGDNDLLSIIDEYKTYIFIGAGALVLIIIIIIIINSNKKNNPEAVNNEPVSNIPNNIPNEPIVTNPLPSDNTVTEQPVPQNNVDINNSNN